MSALAPTRVEIEKQLAMLERALAEERAARRKAEVAEKAASNLLAVAGHEIRTPLGAIISLSELLVASELDSVQKRYAGAMNESAVGLLDLLNDILDYSRIKSGHMEIFPRPFDLRAMLDALDISLQAGATKKGLVTRIDISPDCPQTIIADRTRFSQILNNLIANALKFTEAGSVEVSVRMGSDNGMLTLRVDVADTGIGMTDDQKARLFRPYSQADGSISEKYGGTGLGLTISRSLVELLGGTMGCESRPGVGSIFSFVLPVDAAQTTRPKPKPKPVTKVAGHLNGHLLVAEDNHINQALISVFLRSYDLTFDIVNNGREALEAVETNSYDLVLMDIRMPEMGGLEATAAIRALDSPSAKLPIIALTANAFDDEREKYLAAGLDEHVSKPVEMSALFSALAKFLPVGEMEKSAG